MSEGLRRHLARRRDGVATGVTSVCSAHPWVIRAAVEQAAADGSPLLVEATSNQVNQAGGYTGMRPAGFRAFALEQVRLAGLGEDWAKEQLTLGGDHLGPNPWRKQPAAEAMELAEAMVAEYVAAGFTKIHLDASMALGGDAGTALPDEVVAERAVRLCRAAEAARPEGGEAPVYVIGTEVPVPGGATHALGGGVEVTSTAAAEQTREVHRRAFAAAGLEAAWERVLAMVVQPGVEFDHDSVVEYDRAKARGLTAWLGEHGNGLLFEAHSTDYQRPQAYPALVEDGFAILKVGPALTFAMREALYALADMEAQLVAKADRSRLPEVVEETMMREPGDWAAYYGGDAEEQRRLRVYSYSDRVRYYWHKPEIAAAVERLMANLRKTPLPETMLSRYLPAQYGRVRAGVLAKEPEALVVDAVREVLRVYGAACARG